LIEWHILKERGWKANTFSVTKRAQFTSLPHCPRSKCMLRLYSTVAGFESRHSYHFPFTERKPNIHHTWWLGCKM
jgi:hypothetical protein